MKRAKSEKVMVVTVRGTSCRTPKPGIKISAPYLSKKVFTAEELNEVAVPPPFTRRKMSAPSLIPASDKWECFECGKIIGKKKICPHCKFDSRND